MQAIPCFRAERGSIRCKVFTRHLNGSCIRCMSAGRHFDQGRLARPIFTKQGVHLACLKFKIHTAQGANGTKRLFNLPEGKNWNGRHGGCEAKKGGTETGCEPREQVPNQTGLELGQRVVRDAMPEIDPARIHTETSPGARCTVRSRRDWLPARSWLSSTNPEMPTGFAVGR
jgi:hypothetical protein